MSPNFGITLMAVERNLLAQPSLPSKFPKNHNPQLAQNLFSFCKDQRSLEVKIHKKQSIDSNLF
jgi:hypothetical protein